MAQDALYLVWQIGMTAVLRVLVAASSRGAYSTARFSCTMGMLDVMRPNVTNPAASAAAAAAGCSAPDVVYDCPICFNETTRTLFWGFVSCIVNLQDLATGSDARLLNLTEMVRVSMLLQ
jgi:hypothetical protein